MNTLWIIANCCNNATELAAPIIKEGTNDCTVLIAAIVCISLVLITLIAAITVSHWHKKELEKSLKEKEHLQQKEKEDRVYKLKANYQSMVLEYIKEQLKNSTYKADNEYEKRISEYINTLE